MSANPKREVKLSPCLGCADRQHRGTNALFSLYRVDIIYGWRGYKHALRHQHSGQQRP